MHLKFFSALISQHFHYTSNDLYSSVMDSKLGIILQHMVKIKFVTFRLFPQYSKFRDLPITFIFLLAYCHRPNFCAPLHA